MAINVSESEDGFAPWADLDDSYDSDALSALVVGLEDEEMTNANRGLGALFPPPFLPDLTRDVELAGRNITSTQSPLRPPCPESAVSASFLDANERSAHTDSEMTFAGNVTTTQIDQQPHHQPSSPSLLRHRPSLIDGDRPQNR